MSIKNLHIKQLYVLQSLLETNNVTETGSRLNINQATISNILKKLRIELNDQLFYMQGRNILPTKKALSLSDKIDTLLEHLSMLQAIDIFNPLKGKNKFTVIIMEHYILLKFENLIEKLLPYKDHIQIKYLTPHYKRDDLNNYLRKNEIDCCIETLFIPDAHDSEEIAKEDRVLLYHPNNKLVSPNLTKVEYMKLEHVGLNFDPDILNVIPKIFNIKEDKRKMLRVDGLLTIFSVIERLPTHVSLIGRRLAEEYASRFGLVYQDSPVDLPQVSAYITWPKIKSGDARNIWLRNFIKEVSNNGN